MSRTSLAKSLKKLFALLVRWKTFPEYITPRPEFSLDSAQKSAEKGDLEAWLHRYLNAGPWANKKLSRALKLKDRFWVGPVEIPVDNIDRICGTEPHMPYPEDQDTWRDRINLIADSIEDPRAIPPIVLSANNSRALNHAEESFRFVIADGAHRFEALKKKGLEKVWAIIWFDTEAQCQEYCSGRQGRLIIIPQKRFTPAKLARRLFLQTRVRLSSWFLPS